MCGERKKEDLCLRKKKEKKAEASREKREKKQKKWNTESFFVQWSEVSSRVVFKACVS